MKELLALYICGPTRKFKRTAILHKRGKKNEGGFFKAVHKH